MKQVIRNFGREKRGNPKDYLKLNFWIPPLFIYLAICGGRISCKRPVDSLFSCNTRLVNQISYPNIRNDSSINAGMSSGVYFYLADFASDQPLCHESSRRRIFQIGLHRFISSTSRPSSVCAVMM